MVGFAVGESCQILAKSPVDRMISFLFVVKGGVLRANDAA